MHRHLIPRLGRHLLGALQPLDVSAALADMRSAGLSARSCTYARAILRSALHDASRWGLIGERNAASLSDVPKGPAKPGAALSPDQAAVLLDAAAGQPIGPLVTLLLSTGLRLGEALALVWDDVDPVAGRLHVRRTLGRARGGGWQLGEPKSASGVRTVPLIPLARAALQTQSDRQAFDRQRAKSAWQEHGFVFASVIGTPLDGVNCLHRFKRLLARAGLQTTYRLHDLRHSAATFLLAGGVDGRVVLGILGWSQASMLTRYQHLLPAMLDDAAERLERVFAAAT